MKKLAFATLIAALCAASAIAQSLLIPEQILRIKATSLVCNAANDGKLYRVFDASATDDCDTTGGGAVSALCLCDQSAFVPLVTTSTDLAAYVPVTKAGQQTITATGTGNDITLTAADKIISQLGSAGYFEVKSATGTAFQVEGGASSAYLYLESFDATNLNNFDILPTVWTVDINTGSPEVSVSDKLLEVSADTILDAGGGSNEVAVTTGVTTFTGLARLTPAAAPPAACAGGTEGGLYLDSDTHLLCVCNGTGWVQVADGTTGCS